MIKVGFVASVHPKALEAKQTLEKRYRTVAPEKADVLVVLGGDGFMLHTLHEHADRRKPLYGMKIGEVGFLMNRYLEDALPARLAQAEEVCLSPLRMRVTCVDGSEHSGWAINEVSLLRQTNQAAHIRIQVNGRTRIDKLVADGTLVSTAAGSTAYNLSASGPILPLGTEALTLTPISPFRPRRWRGAILPAAAEVRFEILNVERRPVSATADYDEIRDVTAVDIVLDRDISHRLLFDPEHSLEERILNEQFLQG